MFTMEGSYHSFSYRKKLASHLHPCRNKGSRIFFLNMISPTSPLRDKVVNKPSAKMFFFYVYNLFIYNTYIEQRKVNLPEDIRDCQVF